MRPNKLLLFLGIILFLSTLAFAYLVAANTTQEKLQSSLKNQLLQVVNELKITLERHSYLPALLSSDPAIKELLHIENAHSNEYRHKQLQINLSLELTSNLSESSVIYIMRPDGSTIASSNWESEQSFIGSNFAFRPYFKQAKHNTLGRYYAVGAISGVQGYFFASSVLENEKVIGVVAVKIAIDDIEFTWGQGDIDFMVTDLDSIIFLASQKNWKLHSLKPLSKSQKKEIIKSRRYGDQTLTMLKDTKLILENHAAQTIKLMGDDYEMLTHRMELANWDVRVIKSHSDMKKAILSSLFISALILLLLTALAVLLWKTQQQRKKYQQQITEKLEKKVIERTQALKQTQEDLIQAAKMAALGELSAGIRHEINNPLTAIRAYADNAKAFLQKDRLDMVESNLVEISNLTESMATITRQLKSFSRKSKGQLSSVFIVPAINRAISIVNPKLLTQDVTCHWNEESEQQRNKEQIVQADEVWLGQILVNLLTNAISATQEKENRDIWINIDHFDSMTCIHVKDNGAGIKDSALPHIFEPFFTTKPSTKGLGLGLSISFNLAKEMNGSLNVKNLEIGGAEFILCLPKIKNKI